MTEGKQAVDRHATRSPLRGAVRALCCRVGHRGQRGQSETSALEAGVSLPDPARAVSSRSRATASSVWDASENEFLHGIRASVCAEVHKAGNLLVEVLLWGFCFILGFFFFFFRFGSQSKYP